MSRADRPAAAGRVRCGTRSGASGCRRPFLPAQIGAIEQQPDMVQYIAAQDANVSVDPKEASTESPAQEYEDNANRFGLTRRTIERHQLITLTCTLNAERFDGG